jgi:hypothetical protein
MILEESVEQRRGNRIALIISLVLIAAMVIVMLLM